MQSGTTRRLAGYLAAVAIVFSLTATSTAQASWVLTLTDEGTSTTVTRTGTGSGAVDVVVGNFDVFSSIGDTTMTSGSNATFTLGFNSFDVNNTASTTDTLKATLKENAVGPPFAPLTVNSALSDTLLTGLGSSVSFETFVNSTHSTTLTLTTFPASAASPSYTIPSITVPYTVTNVTTIKLAGSGLTNESGTSTVFGPRMVPEPATLTLAAFGLASCGVFLRRRKTRAQA